MGRAFSKRQENSLINIDKILAVWSKLALSWKVMGFPSYESIVTASSLKSKELA
jgi:hypothetical protein